MYGLTWGNVALQVLCASEVQLAKLDVNNLQNHMLVKPKQIFQNMDSYCMFSLSLCTIANKLMRQLIYAKHYT
jgi:hypothetical protein